MGKKTILRTTASSVLIACLFTCVAPDAITARQSHSYLAEHPGGCSDRSYFLKGTTVSNYGGNITTQNIELEYTDYDNYRQLININQRDTSRLGVKFVNRHGKSVEIYDDYEVNGRREAKTVQINIDGSFPAYAVRLVSGHGDSYMNYLLRPTAESLSIFSAAPFDARSIRETKSGIIAPNALSALYDTFQTQYSGNSAVIYSNRNKGPVRTGVAERKDIVIDPKTGAKLSISIWSPGQKRMLHIPQSPYYVVGRDSCARKVKIPNKSLDRGKSSRVNLAIERIEGKDIGVACSLAGAKTSGRFRVSGNFYAIQSGDFPAPPRAMELLICKSDSQHEFYAVVTDNGLFPHTSETVSALSRCSSPGAPVGKSQDMSSDDIRRLFLMPTLGAARLMCGSNRKAVIILEAPSSNVKADW